MLPERERALHEVAGHAGGSLDMTARIERLSVPALQLGLVVEGIHLADAAVHEKLDHTAHLGSMVQPAIQLRRRTDRPEIGPGEQPLLAQQMRQGNATQATAQPPEEVASCWSLIHRKTPEFGWQPASKNGECIIADDTSSLRIPLLTTVSQFKNKNSLLLKSSRQRFTRPCRRV